MKMLLGSVALCLVFVSGCASPYHVFVSSINNGTNTSNRTCYIDSGMEDVSVEDLTFKEFSAYVRRSMENRGYRITNNLEGADTLVLLGYGIGDPKAHTSAMPVFGQTGISSSTTYGTINSYGSGYSTFSGTTYHTPTYGITGFVPITQTVYTRYVRMTAYDLGAPKAKEVMLWDTEIVSTGSTGDLRRAFPVMMAAATPHIGSDTGKKLKVVITENSKEVRLMRASATHLGSDESNQSARVGDTDDSQKSSPSPKNVGGYRIVKDQWGNFVKDEDGNFIFVPIDESDQEK